MLVRREASLIADCEQPRSAARSNAERFRFVLNQVRSCGWRTRAAVEIEVARSRRDEMRERSLREHSRTPVKERQAQAATDRRRYEDWFARLSPIEQPAERQRLNSEQNLQLVRMAAGAWLLDGIFNPTK